MYKLTILVIICLLQVHSVTLKGQSRDGIYKSYHKNGQIKSSEIYKKGQKAGLCKYYYENGKLRYEEAYNEYGMADGLFKSYYENGQLESLYTYRNNIKSGIYQEFYENGRLREEGRYDSEQRIPYQSPNTKSSSDSNNTSQNNRITESKVDNSKVFENVDIMPTFSGGDSELRFFLAKNLKYPTIAAENRVEGRVIIRFVVGVDGSISDIEIVHSLNSMCDREAIRVVKLMPKWIPGTQDGIKVPVYFTLPVIFKLPR